MSTLRVRYRFNLPKGQRESFDLFFEAEEFRLLNPIPKPVPFWAELGFNQCENCPVKARGAAPRAGPMASTTASVCATVLAKRSR